MTENSNQSASEGKAEAKTRENLTRPRSHARDVWDQFRSHKGAMAGAAVLLTIILIVVVGPFIWTIDATYIDIRSRNSGPTLAHPLGTDQLGRDLLARVMAGGRVSIAVGLTAILISIFLGTLVGVLAGYFKRLDSPLMRTTDLFLALPLLPILLVMVMLFRETLSCLLYTSPSPRDGLLSRMPSSA